MMGKGLNPLITFEHKRDAYGFAIRPQLLQRYREYANIYKEEEEERSGRWKIFLERQAESAQLTLSGLPEERQITISQAESTTLEAKFVSEEGSEQDGSTVSETSVAKDSAEYVPEKELSVVKEEKTCKIQIWAQIRPSLGTIEHMMSFRVKKRTNLLKVDKRSENGHLAPIEEARPPKGSSEERSEDECHDLERSDPIHDNSLSDTVNSCGSENAAGDATSTEHLFHWKEELECLVQGGVPMTLRGELWQAFAGVRTRRIEKYYQGLLDPEANAASDKNFGSSNSNTTKGSNNDRSCAEKWKGQIEKDLPRTFPGHPALDEDGRNALRRLLTAYARHNPAVGYCQAMNFFAGLLLLIMPEENAFWTLVGIIDDYFDGYFSEEMIEPQVDQLVLEEIVRERFPKLVNHLDYLGVQVAWVTGPWFLSIFMNMLPWESVLRVWDVLLFEGSRVMLFRTALALMDLYGPELVRTKDAGDAVTLMQSLVGSTFDSSQLVFTACMGYQVVNEARLQELREKHRPAVIAAIEERSKGLGVWKDSRGLASKLYSFKHEPGPLKSETNVKEGLGDLRTNGDVFLVESGSSNLDGVLGSLTGDSDADSLQEQVVRLKVELCRLLEEKRSAVLRTEELETAFMEIVKKDTRRQLSLRVEQLEQEVAELKQALKDKSKKEQAVF
ncbi:PREDICTED: ecotropic viral integration site 5 protein homolog isoform X2 [Nelumbo nucifera]|uniref:Ecotropic viral integration site 5 protein homolog isoform X2 n=1 Tax=Nelumbo nucifera TaxID=4432 RepID=A0A1U8Q456_NELNU|nr:PREDICTED: ecotropic viral integration site 5 protein homolog isoform X2 [Nelumbo nucifera]